MLLKQFRLSDKEFRIIYGKLLGELDVDYTQGLDDLRLDIEESLSFLERSNLEEEIVNKLKNEEIIVYRGGHHLDIVINGEGSLGWLTIEDNPYPLEKNRPELKQMRPFWKS